jgi:hypothetical protein
MSRWSKGDGWQAGFPRKLGLMDEVRGLPGGMGNQGHVVRLGSTVRRPPSPHSPAIRPLLDHLAVKGLVAPVSIGVDEEGREACRWIEGQVAVAPFPDWSLSDEALASVGLLLRRYHEAAQSFCSPPDARWSSELADPAGGPIICHNDVCPENVVFVGGQAIALLDFDFAAPGRPIWDLAAAARMWIPLRPPDLTDDRAHLDRFTRLSIFVQAYGLPSGEHQELVESIILSRQVGSAFVRRRVDAGEAAFVEMWKRHGGDAGSERTLAWLEANRHSFLRALRSR